jgi:hypothetical protein
MLVIQSDPARARDFAGGNQVEAAVEAGLARDGAWRG